MQTSISAWLKKAVTPKESLDKPPESRSPAEPQRDALPTPPPERHFQDHTEKLSLKPSDFLKVGTKHNANEDKMVKFHPNISFSHLNKDHISQFKRINSLLLQIPYGKPFYDEILSDPVTASISLVALWHDEPPSKESNQSSPGKVVGGIRCRILTPASSGIERAISSSFPKSYAAGSAHRATTQGEKILYISALTLLSPYRGLGIAAELLTRIEQVASERFGVVAVGAHAWDANEEGLKWYRARGFREVGREESYYRRLDPQGAVVLRREINSNG
ncbi:hypothetical protein B9Z65_7373 [Elsinoe australis]|uniref:N-acetyltransferase domain-containing protein n=1 Tax=Elsinoe australis TaxID=40998 RepID=A0A2P7YBZ4_9PEZI|nr:hypothetical protein B9Z65_7373 [Elsinoe australis]